MNHQLQTLTAEIRLMKPEDYLPSKNSNSLASFVVDKLSTINHAVTTLQSDVSEIKQAVVKMKKELVLLLEIL